MHKLPAGAHFITKGLFGLFAMLCTGSGITAQHMVQKGRVLPCLPVGIPLQIDTLPIVSGSLEARSLNGEILNIKSLNLDAMNGKIHWSENPACDSFFLSYRVYIFPMQRRFQLHTESEIQPPLFERNTRRSDFPYSDNNDIMSGKGGPVIEGMMLRGFSTGNNQDLVPLSGLNLRISGMLAPGVRITAAMTEQEVPFQPEGTAGTLQDFDRIYVQLESEAQTLTLGDYGMFAHPNHYFLRYNKKVRGLELRSGGISNPVSRWHWSAGTALARGRFARNQIQGQEGIQGPYRLSGTAGETPVIVVSGTEVVYLDGKKMERGLQNDYVIDYNLGEISFNPTRVITAFSRIVVEFQYSDRNYVRAVSAAWAENQTRAGTFRAGWFNEQDLRNQPLQINLDLYDSSSRLGARDVLEQAGTDPARAVMRNIRPLPAFDPSGINYTLNDSLGISILVYAPEAREGVTYYRVGFSFTGKGRGNYVLERNAANGKVYRWVAPQGGQPAGDYEPVIQLAMPDKLRMFSTTWESPRIALGSRTTVQSRIEGAFTQYDRNTFSMLADSSANGNAAWADLRIHHRMKADSNWSVSGGLRYEHASKWFKPVERFRSVEFERQWNRSLNNPENKRPEAREGIAALWQELKGSNGFLLKNEINTYNYQSFTGKGNNLSIQWQPGNFRVEAQDERIFTKNAGLSNNFRANRAGMAYVRKFSRSSLGCAMKAAYSPKTATHQFKSIHFNTNSLTSYKREGYANDCITKPMRSCAWMKRLTATALRPIHAANKPEPS
jgi:hypothetical protein